MRVVVFFGCQQSHSSGTVTGGRVKVLVIIGREAIVGRARHIRIHNWREEAGMECSERGYLRQYELSYSSNGSRSEKRRILCISTAGAAEKTIRIAY